MIEIVPVIVAMTAVGFLGGLCIGLWLHLRSIEKMLKDLE